MFDTKKYILRFLNLKLSSHFVGHFVKGTQCVQAGLCAYVGAFLTINDA
jgi:hypothetical protein